MSLESNQAVEISAGSSATEISLQKANNFRDFRVWSLAAAATATLPSQF